MSEGFAAADSRLGHTAGVVLCDRASGTCALQLGLHTLAERAALLLAEVCERVVEVDRAATETLTVIAALEAVETDQVLVVSADRPLLTPDVLIGLAGLPDADAAIPRDAHGAHATCARYRRASVGPLLRTAAEAGAPTVEAALRDASVVWLEGESLEVLDPGGRAFTTVEDAVALASLERSHPEWAAGAWPGHPGLGPID